ncbi:MAG: PhnD/SsuA/transferrin family substrate-binding protein, partial [Duodenibacillus sp.]
GAIIVRADRTDLQTLADLKGKRVAASNPSGIDGWLAVRREVVRRTGREPTRFFKTVDYLGVGFPDVVLSVASGRVDAGVIAACAIERAEEVGLIAPESLRVINARKSEALACRHSTDLYPDMVVAALPWTDPMLVRDVTLALLKQPESASYTWQVAGDFRRVTELFEELHLGPWAYLDSWTPQSLWRRFGLWICAALAAVLLLVVNELRLRRLVVQRTAQLTRAMAERDALMKREEAARQRLAGLERMGAISQLCAMIAHELKQPVNSVINYMAVLRIKLLPSEQAGDAVVQKAIQGAEEESQRMADIINRVRGYAKRDVNRNDTVRLDEVASHAFGYYARHAVASARLIMPRPPEALVHGNALEIELLVINLLKNADQAASGKSDGFVRLTIARMQEGWRLTVTDNGPVISDEAFARLTQITDSLKEDGLGLGLAIVRNIVDEHGARLELARARKGGLRISVTFDAVQERSDSKERKR